MDYNKFNDKYKHILEIFDNVEKPIISKPLDNDLVEDFSNINNIVDKASNIVDKASNTNNIEYYLIIFSTILIMVMVLIFDSSVEKYKKVFTYFIVLFIPIIGLTGYFLSKDDDVNKDKERKTRFSTQTKEIISIVAFSIVALMIIFTFINSNKEDRFKNTSIMFLVLVVIPLIGSIIYYLSIKPSGTAPLEKTALYMGLLFLGGLMLITLPVGLASWKFAESIDKLDIITLFISLTMFGIVTLLLNMFYGLFSIDKGKSDIYITLLGILLGFLIFSKSFQSADKTNFMFFWIFALCLLFAGVFHNEFSIFGNLFNKKNLYVFLGFILGLILLGFILKVVLQVEVPNTMKGVIAAMLIMFGAYVNNEIANVYDAENDDNVYILSGIIALLLGVQVSGSIFKTSLFQDPKTYIDQLRDTSTGFAQGMGFRLLTLLIVLMIGYRYLVVVRDDITSTQQFQIAKDVILYVFPIFLIMLFGTNIFKATNGLWLLLYALITLGLLFGYFYLMSNITNSQKELVNYVVTILFILFGTIALAILFLLVGNYMSSLKGVPGILSNLLFYIPCLIIQLIEWCKDQVNNTTPTMGILLIIEIIIILTYVYLPKIMKKATEVSGIEIINNPTKLDEQIELVGGDRFKIPKDKDELTGFNTVDKPRYNYSISMWVFVNTNVNNGNAIDNDLNIFSYDSKPNLKFRINEDNPDGEVSHFIIEVTNEDKTDKITTLKINLPLQKWHYFVFNYNDNAVDVFVNGELHKTYTFSENNRPTYDIVTDNLLIGDDKGLSGAICNTKYHIKPLTNSEIVNTYNLLMNNNPPIINL